MSLRSPSSGPAPSVCVSFELSLPGSWAWLQKVTTPGPPEPEGSRALAARPSRDPRPWPLRSGHLWSLRGAVEATAALTCPLRPGYKQPAWGLVPHVGRAQAWHQPLNGSRLRHSLCPQVPLRLTYVPNANLASHSRAWLWKE
ncbi:unnamed protein product [Pipistrellus nathusii]|uniref:Uncharacterized protein n=1 Tax=Pipistrellus nathusii TaxID=59473 RepID=A0ABN9ZNI3_PIPNA